MTLPMPKPGTGLMTIAFDLDGTLASPTWPSHVIGVPIQAAVDAALEYHDAGYEIIVFTSRPASHREEIRAWLEDYGLSEVVYDIVTDKPRAAMYIDDRAVAFPEAFEERLATGQCAAPEQRGLATFCCTENRGHPGQHLFTVRAEDIRVPECSGRDETCKLHPRLTPWVSPTIDIKPSPQMAIIEYGEPGQRMRAIGTLIQVVP